MTHSPVLVQALAQARIEELRRTGAASARGRRFNAGRHINEAATRRLGWLLVGMGLRLVFSGNTAVRSQRRGRPA